MRLRGGHHGFSTAARAFTLALIAAASLAQFAALSHEMTVRHYRCAEHGELTHVAAMFADAPVLAPPLSDELVRHEADAVDAHEHCSITFTVVSTAAGWARRPATDLPPPPPVATPVAPRLAHGRLLALAAAPKTSPPRA
jgi:hypothetical protein